MLAESVEAPDAILKLRNQSLYLLWKHYPITACGTLHLVACAGLVTAGTTRSSHMVSVPAESFLEPLSHVTIVPKLPKFYREVSFDKNHRVPSHMFRLCFWS